LVGNGGPVDENVVILKPAIDLNYQPQANLRIWSPKDTDDFENNGMKNVSRETM
jgi:hypothetical protein